MFLLFSLYWLYLPALGVSASVGQSMSLADVLYNRLSNSRYRVGYRPPVDSTRVGGIVCKLKMVYYFLPFLN